MSGRLECQHLEARYRYSRPSDINLPRWCCRDVNGCMSMCASSMSMSVCGYACIQLRPMNQSSRTTVSYTHLATATSSAKLRTAKS
eukprot:2194-Eustigmatos_ZCMA.PRE.1